MNYLDRITISPYHQGGGLPHRRFRQPFRPLHRLAADNRLN
ncbi:MAG: hypothetical protein ABSC18_11200 [Verrucomicrobiota bacterium]